jgi:hypothetical protein
VLRTIDIKGNSTDALVGVFIGVYPLYYVLGFVWSRSACRCATVTA